MSWQEIYLNRHYSRARGWVDGTTEFHALCTKVIPRGGSILEIGAGPSNRTSAFLSEIGPLFGVDIDPDVAQNRYLQEAKVIQGDHYPFADSTFECCISNFVLEHVASPEAHFAEVARVLKPGGAYVFRTPNLLHYVSLISWATPHWFHKMVANRVRNFSAASHDPYPTFYRANSRRAIARHAGRAGLQAVELRMVEKEPSYGMASRLMFVIFMAYERVVNSSELFAPLRANIFGVLRKPPAEERLADSRS